MTVTEALRKYPGVLGWMVTAYRCDNNHSGKPEVSIEITGPWKPDGYDDVCISQEVEKEDGVKMGKVIEGFEIGKHWSFGLLCACLVNGPLIVWDETFEKNLQ